MKKTTLGIFLIVLVFSVAITAYVLLPDQIISSFAGNSKPAQTTSKLTAISVSAAIGVLGAVIYMFNSDAKPSEKNKPLVLYTISLMILAALIFLNINR